MVIDKNGNILGNYKTREAASKKTYKLHLDGNYCKIICK